MPRLIDVGKAIAEMNQVETGAPWDDKDDILDICVNILYTVPTVDAVPVVRCKDCKHYRNHPNGMCYAWTEPCTNERGYKGEVHCVEPDDFCSYGERRTE